MKNTSLGWVYRVHRVKKSFVEKKASLSSGRLGKQGIQRKGSNPPKMVLEVSPIQNRRHRGVKNRETQLSEQEALGKRGETMGGGENGKE